MALSFSRSISNPYFWNSWVSRGYESLYFEIQNSHTNFKHSDLEIKQAHEFVTHSMQWKTKLVVCKVKQLTSHELILLREWSQLFLPYLHPIERRDGFELLCHVRNTSFSNTKTTFHEMNPKIAVVLLLILSG